MELAHSDLERLYVQERQSSAQIAKLLHCSEHKVNYWLFKHGIAKRSISEALYTKLNPNGDPFEIKSPQNLEEAILFGLGIGLYWGEGNKSNKLSVRIGNTDPRLIKAFIRFLEQICGIHPHKLKFGLQIFSDMAPDAALQFWQKELNVLPTQFQKVVVTPARGIGTYRNKTKHGVLTVYYNNRKL